MAWLTKSRFLSGLQCQKRLWFEVYQPLAEIPEPSQGILHGVLFDDFIQHSEPGITISRDDGLPAAILRTQEALARPESDLRLYQPAFYADGLAVITDVLVRHGDDYELIEAKATTEVKDIHLPDAAFQLLVLQRAGISVARVYLAHVNNRFVLTQRGDYVGLVNRKEITPLVRELLPEVETKASSFKQMMQSEAAPDISVGSHCHLPYSCPFIARCRAVASPQPDFPVELLPRAGKVVEALLRAGYRDVRDVPVEHLDREIHRRIRAATTTGIPYFDASATASVREIGYPRAYLDFETVGFVIPEVIGSRPYEQLPFQWSLHRERAPGEMQHFEYLAIENFGDFESLSRALIAELPTSGTIFAYNASFERRVLLRLAELVPTLAAALQLAAARLFDLLPVTRTAYYHRDMMGSWSIKSVMPTIASGLGYDQLGEVQEGDSAQQAFHSLRKAEITAQRAAELRTALLRYCKHDTWAMIVLRNFLCGESIATSVRDAPDNHELD